MVPNRKLPRVVVAGLGGGSGKTIAAMALLLAARHCGLPVRAFKKGPDYIDAAWLSWASGNGARNLDSYLMGFDRAAGSFCTHATADGLNVIEGNRGVFDGMDVAGTHSTAALAKTLGAPVLLVLDVTKVTRTAAVYILGAQKLDPALNIAGVILNRVNGRRHEQIIRDVIKSVCEVPIVGAIPKLDIAELVPERHLGLVTPDEHTAREELQRRLASEVVPGLDLPAMLQIARSAPAFQVESNVESALPSGSVLRIGYLKDAAFSFYYADNLETLERAGAELIPISSMSTTGLPSDLSVLYIGGGFPEIHAAEIASNRQLLTAIREAALGGMPIYAECGGLMLLARAIVWRGERYPMAGVLPFETQVCSTTQGHGYTELCVDRENAFYPVGLTIRGHEFHYSKIELHCADLTTACNVVRGTGAWQHRDGISAGNVFAAYTHVHALATPEWGTGLLNAARRYKHGRAIIGPALEADEPERVRIF